MALQRQQVYRLLDPVRTYEPNALISKRGGEPSNRAHGAAFRQTCLAPLEHRKHEQISCRTANLRDVRKRHLLFSSGVRKSDHISKRYHALMVNE